MAEKPYRRSTCEGECAGGECVKLRFLQTSDFHLGGGVLPSGHGFQHETVRLRQREEREALERIVEIAQRESVDCILIPGDLWDHEAVSFAVAKRIMDLFSALSPLPVLVVPGNHDFMGVDSPYHPHIAQQHGYAWPDNVHIIRETKWRSIQLPELPGVQFIGRATGSNVKTDERYLREPMPLDEESLHVLLFHGSQLEGGGRSVPSGQKVTAPFDTKEVIESGIDWGAFGHYHHQQVLRSPDERLVGGYAGVPFTRNFRDSNEKGVIVAELEKGGVHEGSYQFIRTDFRRYIRVEVNLSGASDEPEAQSRMASAAKTTRCTEQDLLQIRATGRFGAGSFWKPEWTGDPIAFDVAIDTSRLQSGFSIENALREAPEGSALGEFLTRMKARIDEARQNEQTVKAERMQLAAQFGYDAFMGEAPRLKAEGIDLVAEVTEIHPADEEYGD
ncbi:hypothetical protein GF324_08640 [bacterium]|nr:hypothetical protein [bacterium]